LLVNNPTKADVNAFAAKFAMVAKLVSKTVAGLNGGILDEILVEQNKGWILLRPIGKADLVLMISVSSEALLGNLRLVAKQMVGDIAKAI
jgi:predicted regulator of Ras-like GTPase activity (Roadblock/LC7/MglB family)